MIGVKMEHHRHLYDVYSRSHVATSEDVYFGMRGVAKGKIANWESGGWSHMGNSSGKFPFEQECEECGWMINYIDDMVMQLNCGYYGKMHYHKRCWDIKLKDNRDQPLWCVRYGFGTWRDLHIEPDWIWNKDTERMEKECLDCKKMMRASPYTEGEKARTKRKLTKFKDGADICGRCYNKRLS